MKGQLTDLDNVAPLVTGSQRIDITANAFKNWMRECGFTEAPGNPNQETFFIYKAPIVIVGSKSIEPNWHITAMTTKRNGGNCRNFHFKVDMAKEQSYYWHYVIHRIAATGDFKWIGDPNRNIPATNEAGGGAAGILCCLEQLKQR